MNIKGRTAIVTGGSRGLGLGLVEALVAHDVNVTVVARKEAELADLRDRLGVRIIPTDVTEEGVAKRILADIRPDILVLNAGAVPRMGRIDQLSWSDFSVAWETDVKAGLYWMQAALNLPLAPGARILVTSSGAAVEGSPLTGGYAGAKRMLWLLAKYANKLAEQKGLQINFQAILPRQIIGGTGIGDEAANAYARALGLDRDAYLTRFGASLPPRRFGDHVITVLEDPQYASAVALNMKGDTGVSVLEGGAG